MISIVAQSTAKTTSQQKIFQGSEVRKKFTQADWDDAKSFLNDNFDRIADQLVNRKRRNQCQCPDPNHEDTHASAHIYNDHIHCFVCQRSWYATNLIGMVCGIHDYPDQLREGYRILGHSLPELLADDRDYTPTYTYQKKEKPVVKAAQGLDEIRDARHKAYLELCDRLSLNEDHRENLINRGMPESELGRYLSVAAYQPIGSISIPGSASGKLLNKDAGFLCPVSQYGSVVAFQNRTKDPVNKYKWLSNRGDYQLGGESPLSILIGKNPEEPILSEGFLKTDLIHQFTERTCIGAAGGNWLSGKAQLLEYQKRCNPHTVRIFADADSLSNFAVARRTVNQGKELLEMGIKGVLIADYGQLVGKELPSPDDWLHEGGKLDKVSWIPLEEFENRLKALEAEKRFQDDLEAYKKSWHLSAEELPEGKFISEVLPPRLTGITAIAAPTGSGKSHQLKQDLDLFRESGCKAIAVNPTNSLSLQAAENYGLHHFQDSRDMRKLASGDSTLALASGHRLKPEDLGNKIFTLDEVTAIFTQLLTWPELSRSIGDLPGDDRFDRIHSMIYAGIQSAPVVRILDAFLTDAEINFIKAIAPDRYVNVFSQRATNKPGHFAYTEDPGIFHLKINEAIADSDEKNLYCFCSDSQGACEAIDRQLNEKGKKTLRIDADTIADSYPLVDEFLRASKDEQIALMAENGIQWLIYSPSLQTGKDIQVKFKKQFCELTGNSVTVPIAIQLIGRDRQVDERLVLMPQRLIRQNQAPKTNLTSDRLIAMILGKESALTRADIEYYSVLRDRECFEKKSPRHWKEAFLFLADKNGMRGWECLTSSSSSDVGLILKKTHQIRKRLIERDKIIAIADAELITPEKKRELDAQPALSTGNQAKVKKFAISEALPGLDEKYLNSPVFVFAFLEKWQILIRRWLFLNANNPTTIEHQTAKEAKRAKINQITYRSLWLEALALKRLGIDKLPEKFTKDSPEVAALIRAYRKDKQAQAMLKLAVPGKNKDYWVRFVNLLLDKVGARVSGTKKSDNTWEYTLETENWDPKFSIKNLGTWKAETDEDILIALNQEFSDQILPRIDARMRAIEAEYFGQKADQKEQKFEAIAPEKNGNEKMAESPAPQGLEVAPDEADLIYKKWVHLEGKNVLTPVIHSSLLVDLSPSPAPAPAPAPTVEILTTPGGDPLVTPGGDFLTIGDRFEVVAGIYRGLFGYLEKTISASDRVWLRFQDWKNTGFDCCKSVLISEIALAF